MVVNAHFVLDLDVEIIRVKAFIYKPLRSILRFFENALFVLCPLMKQIIQIFLLITFIGLNSCCGTFCERRKYAETLIEKIEKFKVENGKLPENVTEIGLEESSESLAYYSKINDSTYIVWYAIGFESNVYYSKTKEWKEEG